MKKISIIMPSLNVSDYICECIDSVLQQSLKDIEIICVDAGSVDGTFEILQKYAQKNHNIHLITSDRKSYGYQMNIALAESEGRYVGIVETDDCVDPLMFEHLFKKAEYFDADIVKSNYYRYSTSPEKCNVFVESLRNLPYNQLLDIHDQRKLLHRAPSIWSGIYKRSFLIDNYISFLETPGASYQDTAFSLKAIMSARRIVLIPNAFVHYRVDNADSSVKSEDKLFCVCDELDAVDIYINDRPELKRVFETEIWKRRLEAYRWNYFRLASNHSRKLFLQRMRSDLAALARNRNWNLQTLAENQRAMLLEVVNSPETFFAKNRCKPESCECVAPLVSVVLALEDGPAPHLSECLDTLQRQTLREVEILCLCPEENEASLKTLEEYATKDNRFVICAAGRDADLGTRKNWGLNAAKGEYVFFAESHIFYRTSLLSRTYKTAEQSGADVVLFGGNDFDCVKKIPVQTNKYLRKAKLPGKIFSPGDLPDDLLQITTEDTWTKLYRTGFLRSRQLQFGIESVPSSPYFTGASLMLADKIAVIPERLAYIRSNDPDAKKHLSPLDTLLTEYEALSRLCRERGVLPHMEPTFRRYLILLLDNRWRVIEKKERKNILHLLMSDELASYRLFDHLPERASTPSIKSKLRVAQKAKAWFQREAAKFKNKFIK